MKNLGFIPIYQAVFVGVCVGEAVNMGKFQGAMFATFAKPRSTVEAT